MFEKTQYSTSLIVGSEVREQPFFLAQISFTEEHVLQGTPYRGYLLDLQDKKGSVVGFLPESAFNPEYNMATNKVVAVKGVVLMNNEAYIKLDSLQVISEGSYDPKDFMVGLDDKQRRRYINLLGREIDNVHGDYRTLLDAIFTKDAIDLLSDRPASLKSFANYHGGLLAATVSVNHICRQVANAYSQMDNLLYTDDIDIDLLQTASLVWGIGKLREWTGFPFKKSDEGKLLGTVGCFQKYISEKCALPAVSVTDEDRDVLISAVIPTIDSRNQVKAVSKEALILQQCYQMYKSCDEYDKAVSLYDGDDEIFFSWPLKAYIKRTPKNTPKEVA